MIVHSICLSGIYSNMLETFSVHLHWLANNFPASRVALPKYSSNCQLVVLMIPYSYQTYVCNSYTDDTECSETSDGVSKRARIPSFIRCFRRLFTTDFNFSDLEDYLEIIVGH